MTSVNASQSSFTRFDSCSGPDVRVVCASVCNCVHRQLKVGVHLGHWRHSVHTHSFLQAAAHAVKIVVTQIIIITQIRLRAHNHAQISTIKCPCKVLFQVTAEATEMDTFVTNLAPL